VAGLYEYERRPGPGEEVLAGGRGEGWLFDGGSAIWCARRRGVILLVGRARRGG
jgi:hypothetical protein